MSLVYDKEFIEGVILTEFDSLAKMLNNYISDELNTKASSGHTDIDLEYKRIVSKLTSKIKNNLSKSNELKSNVKEFSKAISEYEPSIILPSYQEMITNTYGGISGGDSITTSYNNVVGAVYNYSGNNYNRGYSSSYTSSDKSISFGSKYYGSGYMTDEDWEAVSGIINKDEFKCRCGNNCEGKDANIIKKQLIMDLVNISEHFGGKKIHVTSGYRCESHNAAQAGSSSTSYHMSGAAVDFWVEGVSVSEVLAYVKTLDTHNYSYTNDSNMSGVLHYDIGDYQPPAPEIKVIDGVSYIDGIIIANKSYALPSSYNPGVIEVAQSALDDMQKKALEEGINLPMISGFRSYSEQNSIYNNYVNNDGQADADRYSARPGHSEHQTGLAFDLVDPTTANISLHEKEFEWLAEHAHEYGFIIRYPEGKEHITGYKYEPWHVRYVGVETATAIKESGLCFEEYFGLGVSEYK